jgi:hypothetical protein
MIQAQVNRRHPVTVAEETRPAKQCGRDRDIGTLTDGFWPKAAAPACDCHASMNQHPRASGSPIAARDSAAVAIIGTEMPFRHTVFMHSNSDSFPLPAVTNAQRVIRQLFQDVRAAQARTHR